MRKRNILIVLFFIAVIASTLYAYDQMSAPAEIARNVTTTINSARYIMFGGNYEVVKNNKDIKLESGVFKLDTYTGKAWILKVEVVNGARKETWKELFNEKQLETRTKLPHSPMRGLTD